MKSKDIHNYYDIIDRPHHVSSHHPQMSLDDRAAQFAPFAALTGHKEAVNEKERLTEKKRILDEHQKEILNLKLLEKCMHIKEHPQMKVTYFQADEKKSGGKYVTINEALKKIDEYENLLIFMNGLKVNIDDIYEIE